MISLRRTKSMSRVTGEWDAIAELREQQISSGKDHSANFVLAPAIIRELGKVDRLADIGCGTGWLTERAASHAGATVGLDPSRESIAIARERHEGRRITYCAESIEQYVRRQKHPRFDVAISNMAASSAPDLDAFLSSSRRILRKGAVFIATIPHPCFWPIYWGYASHPKFNYERSFAVEGEFRIRKETSRMVTTHFHHPIERYMSALAAAGLQIEKMQELLGRGFHLPRFILLRSRAV